MKTSNRGAVLAAGFALAGCQSGWLPDWDDWREHATRPKAPHRALCDGRGAVERVGCTCDAGFEPDTADRWSCVPVSTPGNGERLVVADTEAQRLYVYDVATLTLVADLPDVAMADHPGFLPLDDGRLLFVDSALNALQIARINSVATPHVERSIPASRAGRAHRRRSERPLCSSQREQRVRGRPGRAHHDHACGRQPSSRADRDRRAGARVCGRPRQHARRTGNRGHVRPLTYSVLFLQPSYAESNR
jgi:hypothetical protein